MSEFSESFHLRASSRDAGIALLGAAGVRGYVLDAENGWVTFVYEGDEPPARDHFERIVAAARGVLVHYDYAEDHGCRVTVFEDGRRVARLVSSFESRRASFDRATFVRLGLMTEADAEQITKWLALGAAGPAVAEALGLPHHQWLSFEYVDQATKRGSTLAGRPQYVDERGAVAGDAAPPLAPDGLLTRWDALAKRALATWTAAGSVELAEGASREALADALADLLAEQPGPAALEEFLLERDDVLEVFASGTELALALRNAGQ